MPGGDGTGPMNSGPMSGRGMGFCAGYPTMPGRGFGGGIGFGPRMGRARRNRFNARGFNSWQNPGFVSAPYAPVATETQELDMLKSQTQYFENAIESIKKRISELEAQKK